MPNKQSAEKNTRLYWLTITALGVVYGDIGTSPLYALRECFYGHYSIPIDHNNILGVLSLIFWSLILVISTKYLLIILRADNEGEGGILALMELVLPGEKKFIYTPILLMGLFGAALLYGDGMITPAISVLSAIEGLKIATPVFESFVIPITLVILFLLFLLQKRGTAGVGIIFGPLMGVWFITLAVLGLISIAGNVAVLKALSPHYAVLFFIHNGLHGIVVLGAVFLVVTGGEALYADLGHFGKQPIRIAWFGLVLPCLLINYFGQGALLLKHPELAINPFYHLAPRWFLYPLVVIAAIATIIASQAVISGAFSLTFQALNLGYLPRLRVEHTSEQERGQIYLPRVNWILFIATAWLVLEFKSSGNLAAAYGVAVSTTMVITSLLAFRVMSHLWKWNISISVLITIFFLLIDISFFGANLLKIMEGGWFPLAVACIIIVMMTTWRKGRRLLIQKIQSVTKPLDQFISEVSKEKITRVEGVAIYLTGNPHGTPPALVHNLKHNHVLHETNVVITVHVLTAPRVRSANAVKVEKVSEGFFRIEVFYGFMDNTNLMRTLKRADHEEIKINWDEATFFLGRDILIAKSKMKMSYWREKLFIFMSRNSERATKYFHLPNENVFEVGTRVEL